VCDYQPRRGSGRALAATATPMFLAFLTFLTLLTFKAENLCIA
jgi:hypothetical protein